MSQPVKSPRGAPKGNRNAKKPKHNVKSAVLGIRLTTLEMRYCKNQAEQAKLKIANWAKSKLDLLHVEQF